MAIASPSRENVLKPLQGGPILAAFLLYIALLIVALIYAIAQEEISGPLVILLVLTAIGSPLVIRGFFINRPRMGRVLVLFGKYKGSVREPGFYWVNPFAERTSISLKAINMASSTIKVNDHGGNPIEIGAVVVWQVHDTAQACFDVEDYHSYADVQVETAVRKLASAHPYDDPHDNPEVISLRGDSEQVNHELMEQLQERLERAGIEVVEARISHLAYAPEIARAMLQRQQASAIIAARRKIVEGAVSMVDDALRQLKDQTVIELDPERKATLVGNLLVVLCGHTDAQPVINTGTLYT
jgi:regulator of protease activity HflC (stomatin/prohibitin superfamily)